MKSEIKCFVIDDQEHGITALRNCIEQTPWLYFVGSSIDPVVGLEQIRSGQIKVDLLFLDVDMPILNGLELASLIGDHPLIIFVTAYDKYALQSYEHNAVDYFLKPFSYSRFLTGVKKAAERLNMKPKNIIDEKDYFFVIGDHKAQIKVVKSDVLYIEAIEKYTKIHLSGKNAVVTFLMISEYEELVNYSSFIRIHKSYIVNIDHIKSRDNSALFLDNEKTLYITKTYNDAFNAVYDQLLIRTMRNNKGSGG